MISESKTELEDFNNADEPLKRLVFNNLIPVNRYLPERYEDIEDFMYLCFLVFFGLGKEDSPSFVQFILGYPISCAARVVGEHISELLNTLWCIGQNSCP